MGHAAETQFKGPPNLSGARPGASVVVLGAGLAGMLAAYELAKAGYKVQIIEYNARPGGRNWSIYGGDTVTELGGATQQIGFATGNYLNPGPWRIPYHHRTILHYCKAFGVALEPFIQLNQQALVHSSKAFGGKPQRYRELAADWDGNVAELLGKAIDNKGLNEAMTAEDGEKLKVALREWGFLDKDMKYTRGDKSSKRRGYDRAAGGGVDGAPIASTPFAFKDVVDSKIWGVIAQHMDEDRQMTMFQPVGGMGMIGKAFGRQVADKIRYGAKVTKIDQSGGAVTVTYTDVASGSVQTATADYCVCTIPLGILSQIDLDASTGLKAAIAAVPYSNSVKIGLEMKSRYWEEDDEEIYGGISFTDRPISMISYPERRPAFEWTGGCSWRVHVWVGVVQVCRDDAGSADCRGARTGIGVSSGQVQGTVHHRRKLGVEPVAVHAGLLRAVERGHPQGALSDTCRCRRPHRARRRARIVHRLLDGRGAAVVTRRDHAAPQAGAGGLR